MKPLSISTSTASSDSSVSSFDERVTELRAGKTPAPHAEERAAPTYAVTGHGLTYAGTHLLIDLWDAEGLDDLALAETLLREAVEAVGATLLNIDLHHFTPNAGISGVAVLAESHMSIHTWPELNYAAVDIFVCGKCDPYQAVDVLRRVWKPKKVLLSEQKRGLMV